MIVDSIERFIIECGKAKTKVITLANLNRHIQINEPNVHLVVGKFGKTLRASYDWFSKFGLAYLDMIN